jgi:transketolase
MRNSLCDTLVNCSANPEFVFLTGDLGYNALEPLQASLGERFINAGVAEQNMVSVAGGLAKMGFKPWVYSIAPFVYALPFEQIRNDVCLHDLPVRLVGNGGGYAYGVMGATHHALEDYGAMLCLMNLRVFVPALGEDLVEMINQLHSFEHPAYLRLGRCEKPKDFVLPPYLPWRRLLQGEGATMLIVGPLAG